MDLAYWRFRHWPFERSFAADRFFAGPAHEEALARLLFLVEESRQCGIVTGPSGTGKTYLLKLLQQRVERMCCLTARCDAMGLDASELVAQIASACKAYCEPDASVGRVWRSIQTRFAAMSVIRQTLVIIIDHFDLVDFSCQQAVRRLHQVAESVGVKMTLVVATRDRVAPVPLEDLLELRIDLVPWTLTETAQFINHAVQQAGSAESLFTDEALESIQRLTTGVPASVVSLGNLSLLATMGRQETLVTRELVEAAFSELHPRFADQQVKPRSPIDRTLMAVSGH